MPGCLVNKWAKSSRRAALSSTTHTRRTRRLEPFAEARPWRRRPSPRSGASFQLFSLGAFEQLVCHRETKVKFYGRTREKPKEIHSRRARNKVARPSALSHWVLFTFLQLEQKTPPSVFQSERPTVICRGLKQHGSPAIVIGRGVNECLAVWRIENPAIVVSDCSSEPGCNIRTRGAAFDFH